MRGDKTTVQSFAKLLWTVVITIYWYHCRFLRALPTLALTLAQKVDLHMSLKMRSLSRHILAEYVVFHFCAFKESKFEFDNFVLHLFLKSENLTKNLLYFVHFYVYFTKTTKTMYGCRKLLVVCLTWSHGCGEIHTKNSLKSKDGRCFMLPRCGSHMIGLGDYGEIQNNSHFLVMSRLHLCPERNE